MHLRLGRRQLGEDAAEPQRLLAQLRAHPVIAGGRRVPLVEDQVDDRQHPRESLAELGPAWYLEGDALFRQSALGAHDALGDCRLGYEESARDLAGGEAREPE